MSDTSDKWKKFLIAAGVASTTFLAYYLVSNYYGDSSNPKKESEQQKLEKKSQKEEEIELFDQESAQKIFNEMDKEKKGKLSLVEFGIFLDNLSERYNILNMKKNRKQDFIFKMRRSKKFEVNLQDFIDWYKVVHKR